MGDGLVMAEGMNLALAAVTTTTVITTTTIQKADPAFKPGGGLIVGSSPVFIPKSSLHEKKP